MDLQKALCYYDTIKRKEYIIMWDVKKYKGLINTIKENGRFMGNDVLFGRPDDATSVTLNDTVSV